MLIIISPDLLQWIEQHGIAEDLKDSIENLALSHRRGLHVVTGSAATLKALAKVMTGDTAGTLKQMAQKAQERMAFAALLSDYIIMDARDSGLVVRDEGTTSTAFRVPYTYFSRIEAVQQSRLIAEDSDDRDVYLRIMDAYRFAQTLPKGTKLSMQGFGGGGSSTADQVRDHAQLGPTICIVDSDKKHPLAALGSTAAAVRNQITNLCHSEAVVIGFKILPCHELENLIPSRLLVELVIEHDGEELKARCNNVCDRVHALAMEHAHYADLKRGVRGFERKGATPPEAVHLNVLLKGHVAPKCQHEPACDKWSDCSCIMFEGIGNSFVRRCARLLDEMSCNKIAETFFAASNRSSNIWRDIGKALSSWAIAASPSRI